VYTCRPDGTCEQKLSTARTEQLIALYGGLYFSDLSRSGILAGMKRSDGSGLTFFENKLGQTAVPFDGAVYFIDNRGDQRVYRMECTEKDETRAYATDIGLATGIGAGEDALYFIRPGDGGRLVRRQNQQDTQITDFAVSAPSIVDGWVYACRADEDGALYRIHGHTGESIKLP
jgi:hypothetical protein